MPTACSALDHDMRRYWQEGKGGERSTHVQPLGSTQQLIICTSNHTFGKSIDNNEFSHRVFEFNGDPPSESLGVIVRNLAGRHMHPANRNGPIIPPESPLRRYVF